MALPITSFLTGVLALLMTALSVQVSLRRRHLRVSVSDGGDETLRRRIRAHGNFVEYVPTALIAVGLVEFTGGTRWFVIGLAAAFLLSRVLHAAGMLYGSTPALRASGMLIQHAAFVVAGIWLIGKAV